MTAIAGLWHFNGKPSAGAGCARMLKAQAIYAREEPTEWAEGSVALGCRLSRLLPEDAHDDQPLIGEGERHVLVADLRLDNREDLIRGLQIPAARAASLCDAAILLRAFERWQETCFDHLVGDYAFAIWDAARRRLILARDPLGQRPLHYHRGNGFFAFASMPKGLHALPEIPYAPDEERIIEFLSLLPDAGIRSFFAGIERVEPGHFVSIGPDGLMARRHWEPSRKMTVLSGPEEYTEALRTHLDEAVRCRLRGVGGIGAHLSAGLDSSAVATTAARLLAPSGRRLTAFTAVPRKGYDAPAPTNRLVDEGPLAAVTAAMHSNMEHVLVRSTDRSPLDDLDRSFFLFDRPILNICNLGWCFGINDAARKRNITIMLSGELGNMSLSYDGLPLLPELFRAGQWSAWWQEAKALLAKSQFRWRGVLAATLGPWIPATAWIWLNRLVKGFAPELFAYTALNPSRLVDTDVVARARALDWDPACQPWADGFAMRLWVLRRVDPGAYIKGILGGWGIDQRDPTADRRLIEFCLSVPTRQYLSEGVKRALARRALVDRVPKIVTEQTRSGYQGADWHERLTVARDRVSSEIRRLENCPAAANALDLKRMRHLVEQWPSEGWETEPVILDYRCALLRGISTGHFLRRATGANY